MRHDPACAVSETARRAAREARAPLLLAVSGGLDSMVLLHAMATVARPRIAGVATFDHATGPAARAAAEEVARAAAALGLPVVTGRLAGPTPTTGREAAWRRERYRFLHATAAALGARVVTAHTEDDQLETVLMRVLRGSGTRGLAGLLAPSPVVRPFLALRRELLARYARDERLSWREDPSNRSREFLRNRVRHDLLPALRRADPTIDGILLGAATRAAAWRAEVESFVDVRVRPAHPSADTVAVAAAELSGYDRDSLAVLWGALAGRVGLALDRRGTERLAAFTIRDPQNGSVPLSGGWCLDARRGVYVLRRRLDAGGAPAVLPEQGAMRWGSFSFRVTGLADQEPGSWTAALPVGSRLVVRSWKAGDRLAPAAGRPRRRVKRYLTEAGVGGQARSGWPVVVAGEDVIWIPGVRRSDAATDRSGRPARRYVCERIDR
jgi:tRNA(Ile)-lysidine synthase